MLTMSLSTSIPAVLAAQRQSWLAACAAAVAGAVAALLLGPAAIDTEIAFRR